MLMSSDLVMVDVAPFVEVDCIIAYGVGQENKT